jgi:hypothetical protein
VLKKLSSVTGGESFFVRDGAAVSATLDRISRDIRSGYTIGYTPSGPAATGFRAVRVQVKPENGHKLNVRARSGYAASSGSTQ